MDGKSPNILDEKLSKLSASVKSQIIISTQSVNLVNEFDPEDVIVVEREDKQTVLQGQNFNFICNGYNDSLTL